MQFKLNFAVLAAALTAVRGAAIAEPVLEASPQSVLVVETHSTDNFHTACRLSCGPCRSSRRAHLHLHGRPILRRLHELRLRRKHLLQLPERVPGRHLQRRPRPGLGVHLVHVRVSCELAANMAHADTAATTTATATRARMTCSTPASLTSTTGMMPSAPSAASGSTKEYVPKPNGIVLGLRSLSSSIQAASSGL